MPKPFLKWAGGKGQLLKTYHQFFPSGLLDGQIDKYVEPLVGGGAVFFHIAAAFPAKKLFISDINDELIVVYTAIREDVDGLTRILEERQRKYFSLDARRQKDFYYSSRVAFNESRFGFDFILYNDGWVERAADTIFLNRTCYNGLFRVNSTGGFNVPFGDYKNPRICDSENLREVAAILNRATIKKGDFTVFDDVIDDRTFVYFDPPYRPLNKTSNFTSYSPTEFTDDSQRRLARYFHDLSARSALIMLSNSDPKNVDADDDFFERLYHPHHIFRVPALRNINSNPSKRGAVTELIITNYEPQAAQSSAEAVQS